MEASRLTLIFTAAIALLCGNCTEVKIPPSNYLGPLRILALVADTPEISLGGSTTITPYVSDLAGGGRPLIFSASACTYESSAEGSCAGGPNTVTIAQSQPLTGLSAPDYTGAAGTFTVNIPTTSTLFAGISSPGQFDGVPYIVMYSVSTVDLKSTYTAYKTVVVSTNPAKNSNPMVTAVQTGGAALTQLPLGPTSLTAAISPASAESYTTEDNSGNPSPTAVENLTTSWYISDGTLDTTQTSGLTGSVLFTPPGSVPPTHDVIIVTVTEDGRGGAAVVVDTISH